MTKSKLNIFRYTDFRMFIRDCLDEAKARDRKYSRRYFCHRIGLSSTNYLKRIIDGSRDLTDDLAQRLSTAMELDREEKVFFYHLVRFGQAKTTEAKHGLSAN